MRTPKVQSLRWPLLSFVIATSCMQAPSKPNLGAGSKEGADSSAGRYSQMDPDASSPGDSDGAPSASDSPGTVTNPMSDETKLPDTFDVQSTALKALNATGAAPLKGDEIVFTLSLANQGAKAGTVHITPRLTSKRFADYSNVKLPTQDVALKGGEKKDITFKAGPFITDPDTKKEYAVNRGQYTMAFDVEGDGITKRTDDKVPGKDFEVMTSNVKLTVTLWNKAYLKKCNYQGSIDQYLLETYSRKGEIFDQDKNSYKGFAKGFDEMMGVKTVFKTIEAYNPDSSVFNGGDILESIETRAKEVLGLTERWHGYSDQGLTDSRNHGFDFLQGLTDNGFGGLAWVGGNSLAAGVFDADPSLGRTQMVLIHENGHNYGAGHCDTLDGVNYQGYVMCSGEKHDHYKKDGTFVWLKKSTDVMTHGQDN